MIDVRQLVDWLGPDGAAAGLESSELTVSDLIALAQSTNVSLPSKPTRAQTIAAIVEPFAKRVDRPINELMNMDLESLRAYLQGVRPSRKELLRLLSEVDIRAPGKMKGSLLDFAAREISDIGMYQRVAKGHGRD